MNAFALRRCAWLFAGASLLATGCAPSDSSDEEALYDEDEGKADGINADEDPAILIAKASRRLSTNISLSDVGKTYGTADDSVPYPDTYWPFYDPNNEGGGANEPIVNSIDDRWGGGAQSPLEKYMGLKAPAQLAEAKAWNQAHHGQGVASVAPWFGLCNGWTASSLSGKPVRKAVSAKLVGDSLVACAAKDQGCTTFEIGDINGLLAEAYLDGDSDFLGARCDKKPADIKRDEHGRVLDEGCSGANAGTLLIVANNFMKKRKKGFAVDAQSPGSTDEIWNQPAYRYTIKSYAPLTEQEAAGLVSANSATAYAAYNPEAKGWVRVQADFSWVTENGPNKEYVDGAQSTEHTAFDMIIELDRKVSDVAKPGTAKIIGGEYLDNSSIGASRLKNFPYLWSPKGPAAEGSGSHNPFLSPKLILQLAAMGR